MEKTVEGRLAMMVLKDEKMVQMVDRREGKTARSVIDRIVHRIRDGWTGKTGVEGWFSRLTGWFEI